MPLNDNPQTIDEHVSSLTYRMERVERRNVKAGGTSGGGAIFVQPNEPPNAPTGTLWFDTDEVC